LPVTEPPPPLAFARAWGERPLARAVTSPTNNAMWARQLIDASRPGSESSRAPHAQRQQHKGALPACTAARATRARHMTRRAPAGKRRRRARPTVQWARAAATAGVYVALLGGGAARSIGGGARFRARVGCLRSN